MAKKLFALTLVIALILSAFSAVAMAATHQNAFNTQRLSLECNADRYAEGDTAEIKAKMYSVDESGNISVQDAEIDELTSSNTNVFAVSGNQITAENPGYAVITAKSGDKESSVIMICTEEEPLVNSLTGNGADKQTIVSGVSGRLDDVAYGYETIFETTYDDLGKKSWFDAGYRYFSAWFYDARGFDGKSLFNLVLTDGIHAGSNVNTDFANDYGYGEFASKWEGKNRYEVKAFIGYYDYSWADYFIHVGGTKYNANVIPSVGWHQASAMLVKDETAEYGWTLKFYIDGEYIRKHDIVPTTGADVWPSVRLRGTYGAGGQDTSILDDLMMAEDVNIEYPDVNRSVSVGDVIPASNYTFNPGNGAAAIVGNAIITYGTFTKGNVIPEAEAEFGVEFTKGSEEPELLKADGVSADGKYAIRVVGSGITAGKYSMRAYFKNADGTFGWSDAKEVTID